MNCSRLVGSKHSPSTTTDTNTTSEELPPLVKAVVALWSEFVGYIQTIEERLVHALARTILAGTSDISASSNALKSDLGLQVAIGLPTECSAS
jgi:hypothetical protein